MVTAKRLVTRARLEGLVLALVALGYLWEIRAIPAFYQMPGVPGPTAFPEVLGIALGRAGLWRLVLGAPADEQAEDDKEAAEEQGEAASRFGDEFRTFVTDEQARYQSLLKELGFAK